MTDQAVFIESNLSASVDPLALAEPSSPVRAAIARHKAALAASDKAFDLAAETDSEPERRVLEAETAALIALAAMPCRTTCDLVEKLRYLTNYEPRSAGEDWLSSNNVLEVALDAAFPAGEARK